MSDRSHADIRQPELFEVRPPTTRVSYLASMWRHRTFMSALPAEKLFAQHQTTVFGNLWHLMNPLLSVAVYYVIFGKILQTDRGIDNFVLFLMAGVFSFNLTTRSFLDGARSLQRSRGLMRSLRFPRALLPFSDVLSNFMTFGLELLILILVAFGTGEGASLRWLALPLVIIIHWMFNLGGAFVTARLNDTFSDVQQIIPFVMRLAMYGSGVMFPIRSFVEDRSRWLQLAVEWNPFISMVDMYRWVFLGSSIDQGAMLRFVVLSVMLFCGGFYFFTARESQYGRS